MTPITELGTATKALQRFIALHAADLPAALLDRLLDISSEPSPVDRICHAAEFIYANSNQLGDAGRELCAQLAQFAAINSWHGMASRGVSIARTMMRDLGMELPADVQWPEAGAEPAPKDEFIVLPDAPEAEEA